MNIGIVLDCMKFAILSKSHCKYLLQYNTLNARAKKKRNKR